MKSTSEWQLHSNLTQRREISQYDDVNDESIRDMMRYFDIDEYQNNKRLFASFVMFETLKNESENKHAKFECLNFDAIEFESIDMNVRENKSNDNIVIVD